MALETATYIDGLDAANPAASDAISTADDHLRLIKATLLATFPNIDGPVTVDQDDINGFAPLASPTFTGTPAAPTASPGTDTTQIATTAFVTAALQAVYPVGSIYTNAANSANPATLLGFGTWTAFGAGRVMVGFNASDPLFDSAEETGGSKDAVVVSHTHTASTNTTGDHTHNVDGYRTIMSGGSVGYYAGNNADYNRTATTTSAGSHSHTVTVDSTGSSGTNGNLQPYITVYMWKRTA